MEAIGIIGLVVLIGLPMFYFKQLPDIIPRHFDASGSPDGYGGKGFIWIMPIIGTIL